MTLLLPEGEERSRAAGVSRRRVLQSVAWATPAVVIATAAPSMAASGGELGAMSFGSTSASQSASTLNVSGRFAFVGTSTALPVTNVVATIQVPSSRVTAAAPTFVGVGWTYTGRTTSGSNTLYTFTWSSLDLSSTNSLTTLLSVNIPKTSDLSALTVTAFGDGSSNGVALPRITASIQASVAGSLVWNTVYSAGKNAGAFVIGFQNRHDGPYSPSTGAAITGITIDVTFANSDANVPTAAGATGWTVTDLGITGGTRTARFVYAGTLNVNDSTTTAAPSFPIKGGKTSTTFTLNGTYSSAGGTFTLPTQTVTVS